MNNKKLGQYFTRHPDLQNTLLSFIKNKKGKMLEPSFGAGDLVNTVHEKFPDRRIVAIEIDKNIKCIVKSNEKIMLKYKDFFVYNISHKFKTIFGNPPYVRVKEKATTFYRNSKLGVVNLYLIFIEKCLEHLTVGGELVLIIPSDFWTCTRGKKLREDMMRLGSFTHVYHPHSESMFKEASQDIMVIRYELGKKTSKCIFNGKKAKCQIQRGNIIFGENKQGTRLGDLFDVKVGIVSGANKIYENKDIGNKTILTVQGPKKYILVEKYPSKNKKINAILESHKEELIKREIRKFNKNNWWEWGALRNYAFMQDNLGEDCIYVPGLTRKEKPFFKCRVQLFDGSLMCLYPRDRVNIKEWVHKLNNDSFLKQFLFSGRYKFTQRTLTESII